LAAAFTESGLAELHLTGPGTDIHLRRAEARVIAAPGVGIFLTHHPLRTAPLAGHHVRAGQTIALLRIGLLLRPVTAPASGHLSAPLVETGKIVGYATPLFHLHPETLA